MALRAKPLALVPLKRWPLVPLGGLFFGPWWPVSFYKITLKVGLGPWWFYNT